MNDPVTWGDLLTIGKWYIGVSAGTLIVGIVIGLMWAWWENRK